MSFSFTSTSFVSSPFAATVGVPAARCHASHADDEAARKPRSALRIVALKLLRMAATAAILLAAASPSFGDIVYTGSNVIFSGTGAGGVSARATFTVDPGDTNVLRLLLENTSTASSRAPSDLLTSFYFNVLSGSTTGTAAPLTYKDASGQVYLAMRLMTDKPASYVPPYQGTSGTNVTYPNPPVPSNLQAFNPNDDTWQFRDGMSLVASQPPLAFGVGTVGNTALSPNNFNGNIVGGFNFGIYVGEVTTQALNNSLLVKDSIRFAFDGFSGFGLSQISPHGVFGFGTNPEVLISVPEPGTLVLAAAGLVAVAGRACRRSVRRRKPA